MSLNLFENKVNKMANGYTTTISFAICIISLIALIVLYILIENNTLKGISILILPISTAVIMCISGVVGFISFVSHYPG